MKNNEPISEYQKLIAALKKTALTYNKDLPSDIAYKLLKVIEEEIKKEEAFKARLDIMNRVRNLMAQYKQLYIDYAILKGGTDDNSFYQVIIANKESAYNQADKISDLISKYL